MLRRAGGSASPCLPASVSADFTQHPSQGCSKEHGRTWHVYHDDTPQLWAFPRLWDTADRHANWFPSTRFVDHVAAG